MKRMICLVALAIASTVAVADPKSELNASLDAVEKNVIAWRRDLHEHPELSNREFRTSELVAEHLRQLGFDDVKTGIAQTGLPFASKARGEYNGEEVSVMHACGHDTHVAMLMGAAEVLAKHRDTLPGTVKFIFQPAEEGAPLGEDGGASMMVAEGVLDGPDAPEAILGLHVWPVANGTLNYRAGSFMAAADSMYITLEGEQTHGSSPWRGADPVYVAGQIMVALQGIPSRFLDITKGPAVITIGSIHGGVRGNIIPERVEMMGTIRTFDAGEREVLLTRLRSTVEGLAKTAGIKATVTIEDSTPITGNDPELLRQMMPTLNWAAGTDKVVEHPLITGAEDFAYYQARIPGLFLMLGVNDPGVPAGASPSNHSPMFSPNEDALMTGVRALVGFAMDYKSARAK